MWYIQTMDFSSDTARQMEFELQFQDDNTSCSSSLSATISEDIDDLRLGAEANMFSAKYLDGDVDGKKNLVQNFVILKESRKQSGEDDANYTFSTISSISDLLEAREGNPEDLLSGLGFAAFEGEESHSSILSRFQSSPKQQVAQSSNQHGENVSSHNIGTEAHEGIIKTQEWLNNQQSLKDSSLPSPFTPKEGLGINKTNNANIHNQGKRLTAQKKRLRWSKSRQSSFEHLLPNLEEEETQPDAEVSDSSSGSHKENTPIAPIRESSQEKDESFSKSVLESQNTLNIGDNGMLIQQLYKLERRQILVQGIDLDTNDDLCTSGLVQLKPTLPGKITVQSAEVVKMVKTVEDSSQILLEPSPLRFSPWKHLSRKNVLDMKVDSFELEEIASKGHPDTNLSTSSAASSDSSSGFDEGSEDLNLLLARQDSISSIEDALQDTMNPENKLLLDTMCMQQCAGNFHPSETCSSHNTKQQQKLHKFCQIRAKMACASGIAEYTLLKSMERRNTTSCSNCANSSSCSPTLSYDSNNKIHPNLSRNSPLTLLNPKIESSKKKCNCDKAITASTKSRTWSPGNCPRQNFQSHFTLASQKNINNNNDIDVHHTVQFGPRRLFHFSSIPSHRSVSLSTHRKKLSQNTSQVTNNSMSATEFDTSLMQSVTAPPYRCLANDLKSNTKSAHSKLSSSQTVKDLELKSRLIGPNQRNGNSCDLSERDVKCGLSKRNCHFFEPSCLYTLTNGFPHDHDEGRNVDSLNVHLKSNASNVR